MPTTTNPYEEAARLRKVTALVDYLDANKITAADARLIEPNLWMRLAEKLCMRPPSDVTIEHVIRELAGRERARLIAATSIQSGGEI